MTIQLKTGIK